MPHLNEWTRYAALQRISSKASLPQYLKAIEDFERVLKDKESRGPKIVRIWAEKPWFEIVQTGFWILKEVLSTKAIPASKAKAFELANRLHANAARAPLDMHKWWDKNKKYTSIVLEATQWPDKQEDGNTLFKLPPFTVHNTVGAEGPELDSLVKGIQRAVALAKKNPIPGFSKVLYGDIHVVAQITKAHHAAWYYQADDSLYMRRSKKTGMDEIHALIHELGHRYWFKFADKSAQQAWALHHERVAGREVDVKLPDVGDPIPLKIRGQKKPPIVTRIERERYYFNVESEGETFEVSAPIAKVYLQLAEKARKNGGNFPTQYSSTDHEEHFCDALALLAMGELSAEHAEAFKAIWG